MTFHSQFELHIDIYNKETGEGQQSKKKKHLNCLFFVFPYWWLKEIDHCHFDIQSIKKVKGPVKTAASLAPFFPPPTCFKTNMV